jgi:hypothetical protein
MTVDQRSPSSESEVEMSAQLSNNPVTREPTFLIGLIITGVALKEGLTHLARSCFAIAPKRPTLMGAVIVYALAKDAIDRVGTIGTNGSNDQSAT